jgi:hypothetical protein
MNVFWRLMICLLATGLGLTGRADAACTVVGLSAITPSSANVGLYTVSTIPAPVTVTVNLSVFVSLSGTGGTCNGGVVTKRTSIPGQMLTSPAGGVTLPYDVTSGGLTVLNAASSPTPRGIAIPAFVASGTGIKTVNKTVTFTINPLTLAGLPASGFYMDQQLTLYAYDTNPAFAAGPPVTFVVSANVDPGCALTAVGVMTMDFTSDVLTGRPAGLPKTVSYTIKCNALARIKATGSALLPTTAKTPVAGFDTLINYRAQVTMTGSSTLLTTAGTAPVSATSTKQISAAGSSLNVSVKVNLIPSLPLQIATYRSVLLVTVSPAL